jgi:hypothetical protein
LKKENISRQLTPIYQTVRILNTGRTMHLVEQAHLETSQGFYHANCAHDTQFQTNPVSETLFQSRAGINLPAEVCLRVIELVIGSETKDAVTLMRLSRVSFQFSPRRSAFSTIH